MSKKRRDSKNRILRSGESQRKDGRYAYKYVDTFGKPQFVYTWKLVSTDKTPAGKREHISLREKEIQKDLDDRIDPIGKKMTICQLYAKQNCRRGNVQHNTIKSRERLMKLLESDLLGPCPIESVKMSDTKEWALRMRDRGTAYCTINNDKRSLKAAFYTAIQDDCVRKNLFDFQLNTVLEDTTVPKVPLTPAQEESLLAFVESHSVYEKYYDEIVILLGTGLRISELCGLTDAALDFEGRTITVDHQLLRGREMGYYIEKPKTQSGVRQVPMSEKVYEALKRVLASRKDYHRWQLQRFPVPQQGRQSESGMELWPYVSAACEEVQQVPRRRLTKGNDAAHILHQLSQCGHESQSVAVHHGTLQYHHDAELLRTRDLRFRKS